MTVPNHDVEALLQPWFHVEMQQALDSPDQRLLICTRNKRIAKLTRSDRTAVR
jgi:hypothetical protein